MEKNHLSTQTEQKIVQMVSAARQVDRQFIEQYIHDAQLGNISVSKATLESVLKSSDIKIREAAALLYTTGNLQEDISISVLLDGLSDDSISIQAMFSIALSRQGERAISELENNLVDVDPKVQFWSAVALTNIDPSRWEVTEILRAAFNDKSSHKMVFVIAGDALNKVLHSKMSQNQYPNNEPIQSLGDSRLTNKVIKIKE